MFGILVEIIVSGGTAIDNWKISQVTADRTITEAQTNLFMSLVKGHHKIPVKVFVGIGGRETLQYAIKIRNLLNQAGFSAITNEGVIELGTDIQAVPSDTNSNPIVVTNSWDISTFQYGTNHIAKFDFSPQVETNSSAVFNNLNMDFKKIGIAPVFAEDTKFLKTGEFGILVPVRKQF